LETIVLNTICRMHRLQSLNHVAKYTQQATERIDFS